MDSIFATRTVKGIKSALTSMPGGLDELYRQTLERIQKEAGDDGTLGMRILSWITHARRPLLVGELQHGLAVEYCDDGEGLQEFDEDDLPLTRKLGRCLRRSCHHRFDEPDDSPSTLYHPRIPWQRSSALLQRC